MLPRLLSPVFDEIQFLLLFVFRVPFWLARKWRKYPELLFPTEKIIGISGTWTTDLLIQSRTPYPLDYEVRYFQVTSCNISYNCKHTERKEFPSYMLGILSSCKMVEYFVHIIKTIFKHTCIYFCITNTM